MKHRLSTAALLIAVFFFGSCSSASKLVFQKNVIIPADYSGVVHAVRTKTQEEYALLDYLGVNWTLHTFNWNQIEHEQGEWNFTDFDSLVDNANAAGVKMIGLLAYDNRWIHEDNKMRRYIPPHKTEHFLQYVKKTVEHFRGRVSAWCIWNEPNFHFWKGTDDEFIEIARLTADAIREVDSEVIILGGGFNRGVFGLPEKFIRKLFENGAMDKADGIAFHPYEINPVRTASLYSKFRKISEDYGFGDKIWLTEVGYPTGGFYPTKTSEKKFPEYVIKTYVLLAASGSKKLLWYQMYDPVDRKKNDSEYFFGLVRSVQDHSSKGAEAFRLCAKYLPDTSCFVQKRGENGFPRSVISFWFKAAGRGALVLWNESPGSKKVHLRLTGTDIFMHDPVSGSANPIQAETIIKVGKMPVFITWQEILQGGEDL
ncbi:MAG: beta-galactosidase [Treponema sp.]|jgi:hypothetical protein|nr:beta-galactosidase [Treponema sp.]